ncbi:mCG1041816 [Mus musculus]|nr:mCG1041816 [Mus musculus]
MRFEDFRRRIREVGSACDSRRRIKEKKKDGDSEEETLCQITPQAASTDEAVAQRTVVPGLISMNHLSRLCCESPEGGSSCLWKVQSLKVEDWLML